MRKASPAPGPTPPEAPTTSNKRARTEEIVSLINQLQSLVVGDPDPVFQVNVDPPTPVNKLPVSHVANTAKPAWASNLVDKRD